MDLKHIVGWVFPSNLQYLLGSSFKFTTYRNISVKYSSNMHNIYNTINNQHLNLKWISIFSIIHQTNSSRIVTTLYHWQSGNRQNIISIGNIDVKNQINIPTMIFIASMRYFNCVIIYNGYIKEFVNIFEDWKHKWSVPENEKQGGTADFGSQTKTFKIEYFTRSILNETHIKQNDIGWEFERNQWFDIVMSPWRFHSARLKEDIML